MTHIEIRLTARGYFFNLCAWNLTWSSMNVDTK